MSDDKTKREKRNEGMGEGALIAGKDLGFWREMWQQARLVVRLMTDPDVPIYLKVLPFLTLIYLLVPFDILPDMAPLLGQLDDITLILVGNKLFIELAPPHIVARHMADIRSEDGYKRQTVEGEVVTERPSVPGENTTEVDRDVTDSIVIDQDEEKKWGA